MNDHTKGPWKVDPQPPLAVIQDAVEGYGIAEISPMEDMEGNARLIAETPMMYEVCKQIVECIRDCNSCDATGIHCGTKADACYDCGGVGQVLGGDDIFAALDARDLLKRLAANNG